MTLRELGRGSRETIRADTIGMLFNIVSNWPEVYNQKSVISDSILVRKTTWPRERSGSSLIGNRTNRESPQRWLLRFAPCLTPSSTISSTSYTIRVPHLVLWLEKMQPRGPPMVQTNLQNKHQILQ